MIVISIRLGGGIRVRFVVLRIAVRCVMFLFAVALVVVSPSAPASASPLKLLSIDEYVHYQPNELGRVPVFMYHNIVADDVWRDPTVDPYMYRTYDEFWNDMLWLYEHDFYLVGMNALISGHLDIPLGKHPVVFTFDDSSSLHFSVITGANGQLEIDPNCAVGLMERFYAEYPGFGRGAHFGIVPAHKFSWPQHEQDHLFEMKVQWLMENGYEIGNHTLSHPNLAAISDEDFAWTVTGPAIWADEFMGADHTANATRVLTLPFGIKPKEEDNPHKVKMITEGIEYDDHRMQLTGVLELTGGSSEVPWSKDWDPLSIPRLPVQDDALDILKSVHVEGSNPYYTSDGNPDTVTVPWPLPAAHEGKLSSRSVDAAGKVLIKYDPVTGRLIKSAHHDGIHLYSRGYLRGTEVA